MTEEGRNGDGATDDSHDGVDLISLLPDVILQTILSSLETKIAVRTCILSKRWRHVWSGTPSLFLNLCMHGPHGDSFNKFIERYTVRKMLNFELWANMRDHRHYVDRWIEFAMSRNVENMSLNVSNDGDQKYHIPDFFYINNSIRQISVNGSFRSLTIPSYVSWISLKMLSLSHFKLDGECIDTIISGCPVLESLSLSFCHELMVLDLSKSLSLRKLDIYSNISYPGPNQIVAPHIRYLRLRNTMLPCTLVDVSSLNEATLNICFSGRNLQADLLQVMVLQMLEKLQNVEKLTFGENFLKEKHIDTYFNLQSLSSDQCWIVEARVFEKMRDWDIESKHMALFMELMFKNTKTLEKMIVRLERYDQGRIFEELLEMVPVLSDKNNVSIVIRSSKLNQRD